MNCKYRVVCDVGTYYFKDMQSAIDFAMDGNGIFQYFNNGIWNEVEE